MHCWCRNQRAGNRVMRGPKPRIVDDDWQERAAFMKWNGSEIVMFSAGEWPMALCQVCMLILVFLFFRYILAVRLSSADELTSKDTVVKEQMKGEAFFAGAKFSMGTIVRVKRGTMDPDRGDISFGGWTGTIDGIGHGADPKFYLIKWSQETLDQMPSAYFTPQMPNFDR